MKLNVSGEILPLSIVNFVEFEKKEKWKKKKVVFVKVSKTTLRNCLKRFVFFIKIFTINNQFFFVYVYVYLHQTEDNLIQKNNHKTFNKNENVLWEILPLSIENWKISSFIIFYEAPHFSIF